METTEFYPWILLAIAAVSIVNLIILMTFIDEFKRSMSNIITHAKHDSDRILMEIKDRSKSITDCLTMIITNTSSSPKFYKQKRKPIINDDKTIMDRERASLVN